MNKPIVIGTPSSSRATEVMLLGSYKLGKEVIIALQRLGVETITVDRYPHAPGHQAYRAHVIKYNGGRCTAEIGRTGYLRRGTIRHRRQGIVQRSARARMILAW